MLLYSVLSAVRVYGSDRKIEKKESKGGARKLLVAGFDGCEIEIILSELLHKKCRLNPVSFKCSYFMKCIFLLSIVWS